MLSIHKAPVLSFLAIFLTFTEVASAQETSDIPVANDLYPTPCTSENMQACMIYRGLETNVYLGKKISKGSAKISDALEALCNEGSGDHCFVYAKALEGELSKMKTLLGSRDQSIPQDVAKSLMFYRKGCALRLPLACASLAEFHFYRSDDFSNESNDVKNETIKSAFTACTSGWPNACEYFLDYSDYISEEDWLEGSYDYYRMQAEGRDHFCQNGDLRACYLQGLALMHMYSTPEGTIEDSERGVALTYHACKEGLERACEAVAEWE